MSLFRLVPLPLSPAELETAARSAIAAFGYETPPVDTAYGFGWDSTKLRKIAAESQAMDRWTALSAVPPAAHFWYRESPIPLVPENNLGSTGSSDPAMDRAGMAFVRLDPSGHVWHFRANPPERHAAPATPPATDWSAVFSRTGLNPTGFAEADPEWTPPGPADARRV